MTALETFVATLVKEQTAGPLFHFIKNMADGITETDPAIAALYKNAKKPLEGADAITWNIKSERELGVSYKGSQTYTHTVKSPATMAILPRAYYLGKTSYEYTQMLINSPTASMPKFYDYVQKCMEEALEGLNARISLDFYGDGTNDVKSVALGTAPIIGLGAMLPTTANTYATIDRSASPGSTFFLHNIKSVASLTAITKETLMQVISMCTHNGKSPDLAVMSDTAYLHFWSLAAASPNTWGTKPNQAMADLGWPNNFMLGNTTFVGTKYLTDDAYGGQLTSDAKKIYFLNTKDGFEFPVCAEDEFKVHPVQKSEQAMVYLQEITWSGQPVMKTPRLNGVIYWS